ncbi:MAG: acyl-CoA dehydrogenase family protein [Candidatus Heimdallarchaeota archaeon]
MVDFGLTEREEALKKRAEQFTREHITPYALDLEKRTWTKHDEYPMEVMQKAYEAGFLNLHIPKEAGGPDPAQSLVAETIISEATAYGCAGIATNISCNNLAFTPLCIGATIEQLQKYVQPLISGEKVKFGAFSLTEREAGSDAAATKTTAEKSGDSYIINGVKCFITNAPVADLFTVFAMTDPDAKPRHRGISCFMVPKGNGVSIGMIEDKMGQRLSSQSEIIFENVEIPADCLVGKEGDGFKIAMMTLDKTRANIAAIAVGVAQRAVDESARYANIRKQFGKPIAAYQAISFTIADMACRAAAARQLTRYAAWLADQGLRNSKDSAFSKWFASDAAMKNAIDAIQVLGGYGYAREYPVEKLARDAKLLQIYEGTNQVQRLVASNIILKEWRDKTTGFKLDYPGRDAPQL